MSAQVAAMSLPMRPNAALVLAVCAALALSGAAQAGQHVFSYDSANPTTEAMTEAGLTFVFRKSLLGERVLKLVETHDIGEADLQPSGDQVLGPGGLSALIGRDAGERDLYEITDQADGKALKRALCHSNRAWLAFGRLKSGLPLRVHAVTYDPASGQARLCVTLDYDFHGEWALPKPVQQQPDRTDRFNDAPNTLPY